jgi:hypothetical protein
MKNKNLINNSKNYIIIIIIIIIIAIAVRYYVKYYIIKNKKFKKSYQYTQYIRNTPIVLYTILITIFILLLNTMKNKKNRKNYAIIIILIIIIIITLILYYKNKNFKKNILFESYNNQNSNYESGISSKDSYGSITFKKPFSNIPIVFTQIIGNGNPDTSYSIQIFNISKIGFQYIKNSLLNSTNDQFTILKMQPSNNELFNWIAYDANSINNSKNNSKNILSEESESEYNKI